MTNIINDPLYLSISVALDNVCDRIEETVHKQREQLEARRKRTELQSHVAAQRRLQTELGSRLASEASRAEEVARAAHALRQRLAITDTDANRLHHVRTLHDVGKELTGIRWDYTAPAHHARGYVKSSSRKLLEWFCESAGDHSALWARAALTHTHTTHDENLPPAPDSV